MRTIVWPQCPFSPKPPNMVEGAPTNHLLCKGFGAQNGSSWGSDCWLKNAKILIFAVFCDKNRLKTVILEQKSRVHRQRLSYAVINHWPLHTFVTELNLQAVSCNCKNK